MKEPTPKDRFLELLDTNQHILHKICHVYGEHDEDRRDLSQEMVYQPWKSFPCFQGRAKFTTWMYRLCPNTAMVHMRRKRHTHRTSSLADCHECITAPVQVPDVAEDIKWLYAAIQGLRRFDRALILLYLERLSYRDIAEVVGISEGTLLVLCNTQTDEHSLVAAGHLRCQKCSPYLQVGLRLLPCV